MNLQLDDFESQKKEIELALARTTLTKIENGTITYAQGQEIARFYLSKIDDVTTLDKMLLFLEELAKQWEIFDNIRSFYRMKIKAEDVSRKKLLETKHKLKGFTFQ